MQILPGIFQRFPGGLQQQPLLRIHPFGFPRGDTEETRIEFIDTIEETAPARHHPSRRRGRRVEVMIKINSIAWNFCYRVLTPA